ncbi:unnamed protein product [Microthlaspi erraticum]|uniref:KIB1-4 beta-propeller domain-containing protein n=1 Tax=Microthlaspi erraticum TaxID=1685480 RepID=A0A6D2HR16_9BRAS|nr:unnamed protein product [Microthlaspi erraticum]
MSLILSRLSRLGLLKPRLVVRRSSLLLLPSNDFSSNSLKQNQTPPCYIYGAVSCGFNLGTLAICSATDRWMASDIDKRAPMYLVYNFLSKRNVVTIGASHGWVATLNADEEGILCLQDDLNPAASDIDPKRISLPPLVTLPHCQTNVITNVSLSSSSPEDQDCVVAVKFLGPQLSFCRPAQSKPEWTNIRIENPCFFSSPVMFSKKDETFRIPGCGGHLIGSWDPRKPSDKPKLQMLRFENFPPELRTKTDIRERLDPCSKSEHLVESRTTGETFLVKWYKKTTEVKDGVTHMKTEYVMVFKIDEQGNAVYTQDVGDLVILLSKSEPFCVPAASFPGLLPNHVYTLDFDEVGFVDLGSMLIDTFGGTNRAPFYIPPQNKQEMESRGC